MSPRRLASASAAALGTLGLVPSPVAAHAIGGTFELPVPLWLYLAGAAAAVAASFAIVAVAFARRPAGMPARPARIPARLAQTGRRLLGLLGLVWWYGAIAVGFLIGDISPLPAVLLWVGIWIALPIFAAVVGNPWPSMSPFRTTLDGLRWVATRAGVDLDAGLLYPRGLARWPAVLLLGVAIWAELILPGGSLAVTVASVMAAYAVLTILGAVAFGRAWLRNAELFEVLLGWYGRIGPLRGRSAHGWFAGLGAARGLGWSDAAFVVLLLSGITYDGLRETAAGAAVLTALLPPIQAAFGLTVTSFLLVDTIALIALYAAFLGAFAVAVATSRTLTAPSEAGPMGGTAGAHAATLLPIAAGYLVAHYLTLVIQAGVWLPSLVTNPLMSLAPDIGWIPIGFVWYLSVAAIVGGHVAGVTHAHRLAVRRAPAHPIRAGLPIVLLMIGYTILSLWIIAQPIVVEAGGAAPESRIREQRDVATGVG